MKLAAAGGRAAPEHGRMGTHALNEGEGPGAAASAIIQRSG